MLKLGSNKKCRALLQDLWEGLERVQAIEPPFDREITTEEGRQRVETAIDALRTPASLIVAVARELGIPNLQVEMPQ